MTWHPTACILCECNCGIEVELEGRTLARIRGDRAHPGSQGYTCNKAMRLDRYQNGPHRLTSPLRRRPDGTFEEIDWDTAISEVAAKLEAIPGPQLLYYGGGGQGNHLGGAYSGALLRALGASYRSGALAQEKTGEAWVDAELMGAVHTRGDFEHAEVSIFVGKNPWMSQSFPRARVVLKEIAKDPARSMIVLDPVVTETAKLADFHLRVKPGSDAWCLAALVAVLVQEDLCNDAFLADHARGVESVKAAFAAIDVDDYAERCGVDAGLIRGAARRIGGAGGVAVFEDLGIQQGPNSTLCSYLNKLLWILTGNFAKPGGQNMHSWFAPLFGSRRIGRTPVTDAPIVGGLLPCNVIPDEILTDHPDRFRAAFVESANPLHSLADSERMREAFDALDLVVVVDVAMTETAKHADYVLPAASQYEKVEATFFDFEFPANVFHLRHPLLEPLAGTLPEPEIHTRIVRALGVMDEAVLDELRAADDFMQAFGAAAAQHPWVGELAPVVLWETLGASLAPELRGAAVLWGLAQRVFFKSTAAVQRAGHADGTALFEAALAGRHGIVFTLDDYEDTWHYFGHPDKRFALELPAELADLDSLRDTRPGHATDDLPIILSAGERRGYTANTIFRDPEWRKRDAGGAVRVSPEDARALGLVDGGRARITTRAGSAETVVEVSAAMQPGHASLPNGHGLDGTPGIAPNSLTSTDWRDPVAGTPWHKHVPARIEAVAS
jgi:anaerobic selenocysteine-containing dehydrogenase